MRESRRKQELTFGGFLFSFGVLAVGVVRVDGSSGVGKLVNAGTWWAREDAEEHMCLRGNSHELRTAGANSRHRCVACS